jgi:hypothetical protein
MALVISFLTGEAAAIHAHPTDQVSDPGFVDFCEAEFDLSSSLSWLGHLTNKAVRTAGYYFQPRIMDDSQLESIPERYRSTAKKLVNQQASRLDSKDLYYDFIPFLENNFSDETTRSRFAFLSSGLINNHCIENRAPSEQLNTGYYDKETLKAKHLVFIPFVFKTNLQNFELSHIVLVVIDTQAKRVEYYDPNGDGPDRRQCYENFCMKDDLDLVKNFFFGEDTESKILVLSNKIQQDLNNCGVHVMDIIGRRIGGDTFEDIELQKVDSDEPMRIRTALVKLFATSSMSSKEGNQAVSACP